MNVSKKQKTIFFKTCATLLITVVLIYPFTRQGGISEGGVFSSFGSLAILAGAFLAFFIAVAFYCRSLLKCLSNIQPKNRARNPRAVWLMFALPYNFVEDFYIIHDVSKSLEQESRTNAKLSAIKDFGKISGFTWCVAQIISLAPTLLGQVAGGVALLAWIYHWHTIAKINKLFS